MASPPQEPQRGMPQTPRPRWGWWLVLLALLVWNAVILLPTSRPEVNIPYTTLLAQVRAGNVAKVRIVGDAIRGSFVKPLQWPQPTPDTTPSPASGSPAPQPPGQPTAAPPATYPAFTTTFPQALGDPTLLPLLEAQRVLVDVAPPPTPWLAYVLTEGLPFLVLLGFFVLMGRKAAQGQSSLFGFGHSPARRYYSRRELLARLAVMLAGRTAEEIVSGDVTTGAESDLIEATRLARRMVTRWGMGDLGLVAFQADQEHPSGTRGPHRLHRRGGPLRWDFPDRDPGGVAGLMRGGEEDDNLLQRDGTVQRPGAGAFLGAGIPTSAIAIIFGLVLLHPAYLPIRSLPERFDTDQLDPLATRLRMRGFLRFAPLADTPEQAVCGEVMHKT
jgi:hypothetical protein